MSSLQQKAVEILRVVALPIGPARKEQWAALICRYSEKAVTVKIEELTRRGYTDYGVGPHGAWLTDKGREAIGDAVR